MIQVELVGMVKMNDFVKLLEMFDLLGTAEINPQKLSSNRNNILISILILMNLPIFTDSDFNFGEVTLSPILNSPKPGLLISFTLWFESI